MLTTEPQAPKTNDGDYWEARFARGLSLGVVGDIGLPHSYNRWLYRVRRQVFLRMLAAIPPAERREVLDVGSGTGFYVDLWRKSGAQVLASDLTQGSVAHIKENYPGVSAIEFDISAKLEGGPFTPDMFQVVSAFDMLFHITDDVAYKQAILNAATLVRPGGYFVLSENLVAERISYVHQILRTDSFIMAVLRAAGFRVVERLPVFCFMNHPVRGTLKTRALHRLIALAAWNELAGDVVGILAFPLELVATGLFHRSGGTDLLICRKE